MAPIRITYDRKGNVLSVRFSKKKEVVCRESDVGKKEVVYSVAADGSVIGFEILNFLSKRSGVLPKLFPCRRPSSWLRESPRDRLRFLAPRPCSACDELGQVGPSL